MQLLLALLVCAAAGPLPAARAGEPPHSDTESLLLNVHDLGTTAAPDDAALPPTNAPADGTATGGREGGSDVELVKAETEDGSTSTTAATTSTTTATTTTTTTAATSTTVSSSTTTTTTASVADQPSGDIADPPADSSGVTSASDGDDGDSTTASPDASPDPAVPRTDVDAAEDGQEMTINGAPIVAADVPSTTTTTTAATAVAEEVTTTSTTELPVRLVSGVALPPNQPTLSRHRADPGLAPSETKPSKARTGVPDPEMLDNPSKPRKGAPPSADTPQPQPQPTPSFFGGLSVTEGTPVTGSVTPPTSSDAGGGAGFFGGFFGSNTASGSSTTAQSPGAGEQEVPQTTEAQSDAQTEPTTEEPALKHKPAEARDDSESAPGSSSDVRGSVVAGAVVLVILVLIIGFFVVRRLRETWYRRHYRKMDFLVDGMYNL